MAILGGSPLGLINTRSLPTSDGMTTFNGGASRKISVNSYNNATAGQQSGQRLDGSPIFTGELGTRSLFSGSPSASLAPYGNIGKIGTTDGGGMDMSGPYKGIKRSSLHNNTVYDTSLLNIIEQLAGTQAELRPADFAYLKDVGVFPNNRLMIARRFLSPHQDNIYVKGLATGQPSAIMISWKPQGEEFISINFGEKWEEAKGDFKDILDSLGEDFLGKTLGQKIGGGVAVVPLPGFTETFQRKVLREIGVLDDNDDAPLPSGNPNLIKMAKRRSTVANETAGSGLNCTVSITMICEWEQKFISGIDPTIAWQDIIGKIVTFATSRSNTYGLTKKFEKTVKDWMDHPDHIFRDMIKFIKSGLKEAAVEIQKMISGLKETLAPTETDPKKIGDAAKAKAKTAEETKKKQLETLTAAGNATNAAGEVDWTSDIMKGILSALSKQLNKYRLAIEGVARALSGAPSTPWHITIGNPLRPIFCAGDMYMADDLKLDLGATLAFNDLPSNIKATFTLTNARPWGLQEITAKFNSGSIRVVTIVKDSNDLNHGEVLQDQIYVKPKTDSEINPTNSKSTTGAVTAAVAGTTTGLATTAGATVPTIGSQLPPTILPVAANNLTIGAATTKAQAQNSLDTVTVTVNSGKSQVAEATTRLATANSQLEAYLATGIATVGQNVTTVQSGVATVGANVATNLSNATSTTSYPRPGESINSNCWDPNVVYNIDWSAFIKK